ncbi:hypothetical protein AB0I16_17275 [Streptomyces sp. NPDC050703]|uniref:hypothetical protein n=1 Tax=Streptomyces sp. NPDC050703 TaxID=3157218 RepID=UPI0034303CAE
MPQGQRQDPARQNGSPQDPPASTRNVVDNSDIHGDLTVVGNIFHSAARGKAPVFATAALVVIAAAALYLALGPSLTAESKGSERKPAKTQLQAQASLTNWGCGDSAVVPGLKVGTEGMAPLKGFPRTGVHASGGTIEVVLQGTTDEELIITGARAEIVQRRAPVRGTHVITPCGSDAPIRVFDVDLDKENAPLTLVSDGRSSSSQVPRDRWKYAVKLGDAETFAIRPRSKAHDVEFQIVISWNNGGKDDSLTLKDKDGKPFRFTATSAAESLCVASTAAHPFRLFPAASPRCRESAS